jgi:hypothetical protein
MPVMGRAALMFLASGLSFAGSWRGVLVDFRCYDSEEHNVNPHDSLTYVDRDRDWEIRFCSPSAKSKSFALVQADGQSFQFDADGNRKAAELVRQTGKKQLYVVVLTGEANGKKLMVESIALAK